MAQARSQQPEHPRLHPGGKLESGPESDNSTGGGAGQQVVAPDGQSSARGDHAPHEQPGSAEGSQNASGDQADEASQQLSVQSLQRHRRKLLHDCERLLLLDFDTLAMPFWPDHHRLHEARRRRDAWLVALAVLSAVVLAGLGSMVPALIAGVAVGVLVLTALWGVPAVRHTLTPELSYSELLLRRRQLLRRARKHIEHLEGKLGLAACCRGMAEYNPALRRSRFNNLYRLSGQGRLASAIRTRAQAQFYLIFALEAEKAYNRLRDAYLRTHEELLERGESETLDAAAAATDPDLVPPAEPEPPKTDSGP